MSAEKKSEEVNYKRHTARYRARRRAADILFEAETRDVDPVAIVEDRVALARDVNNGVAPISDYTREIIEGAATELDAIDEAITRYLSEDWEYHRLPAVDRAILRVGCWELLFNPEVPAATAIVEAVEIASEYSTDKAAPYIHAVLDDIAQSRSDANPMNVGGVESEPEQSDGLDEELDSGLDDDRDQEDDHGSDSDIPPLEP
ncbi:hypothetical protein CPHO_05635 [Corynebacterium phocae]|uniref:Transcription antitermination protein NusB n=1 Tax=Corynebacterium phocae TaxID=161895 RepID=A0A1L7D373_9CORY|nr:transcription antitermination factor NusB [Corynebacterium phocae]APT92451.1 hypothetical protein CPHO_05635 [Corynebacterium phocae]KAA8725052.1 transcription antitermination factor NusB [Corynebacterium phocae]